MIDQSLDIDHALLTEFIDESIEMLTAVDALFVKLEASPGDEDIVQAIFRPVHSIKGNASFFGFNRIKTLAHETETLLDKIRRRSVHVSPAVVGVLLRAADELKAMLGRARASGPEIADEGFFTALIDRIHEAAAEAPPPTTPPAEAAEASSLTASESKIAAKTMRISETHIDTFLSYVGELLVVGDMFNHLQGRLASERSGDPVVGDFRRINETFGTLSMNLQRSIMTIRKIPIGTLLGRAPRLVRDVAAQAGKEIRVVMEGEQVQVDKSLVDLLNAPLTHLVRNAADHGIENPDARQTAGKPRQGTIILSAVETNTSIVLAIRDDGKGIDREALKAKALDIGLIQPGQTLGDDDVMRLLFASGVSTASAVTDVSGRGVGMDIVCRTVQEANGRIEVESEPGKGTTFSVHLPKSVTTQIMEGFLVEVCGHCYVLPMDRVRETMKIPADEIRTVTGRGRCIRHHDRIKPVIDLHRVLGLDRDAAERDHEVMVTVESRRTEYAVAIDGLRGVQQVVLSPMGGLEQAHPVLAGAAMLGDGTVAVILDVDALTG